MNAEHNLKEKNSIKKQVEELQKKFRGVIENMKGGYFEVDLYGNYVVINDYYAEYLGLKKNDIIGRNYSDFLEKETLKDVYQRFNEAYRRESEVSSFETRVKRRNGAIRDIEGSIYLKQDEDGKIIGFYGFTRDITEKKQAEKKLRESEEKLRFISENANDIITIIDQDFKVEYINEEALKNILGYSKKDIVDDFFQLVHPDELKSARTKLIEGFKREKDIMELRVRHKDGHYVWMETRGRIFTVEKGVKKGILISRNVTARKHAEQKLKESEERVRNAYEELQLYQDLFTHDINNLLQIQFSSVELLEIYLKDLLHANKKEINELLTILKEQAHRGKFLASNVIKNSLLENTEIRLQKMEIIALLQQAREFVRSCFSQKNITIVINNENEQYHINASELLLDVFENLLMNAVKFTDDPSIHIEINISRAHLVNGIKYLRMEFLDNGVGISDATKKLVFESWITRTDEKTKDFGMGLALVKKIIEKFNGKIWVEDRIPEDHSKGSKFVILLPEHD